MWANGICGTLYPCQLTDSSVAVANLWRQVTDQRHLSVTLMDVKVIWGWNWWISKSFEGEIDGCQGHLSVTLMDIKVIWGCHWWMSRSFEGDVDRWEFIVPCTTSWIWNCCSFILWTFSDLLLLVVWWDARSACIQYTCIYTHLGPDWQKNLMTNLRKT